MTQAESDNHKYDFHRFQQKREKFYIPKFNQALQLQVKEAAKYIRAGQSPIIHSEPIYNVIKALYKDVAIVYGAKVLTGIKRDQKARMPMGFSDRMLMLIRQYYGLDFLTMSEDITQTTRDYIQKVLTESYPLGLGVDDIVERITDREISRQRAAVIARTEVVGAANNGGLIVAKDTGLNLDKVWISARDSRTRRDHIIANGKKVGIDDFFIVGGYKLKVPGDRGGKDGQPKVPGKEIINCRCSAIYEKGVVR